MADRDDRARRGPAYSSSGLSVTPYSCFASAGLPRLSWIERVDAELTQLGQDVGHLAVAQVVAVFLERQPEDADARALHRECPALISIFTSALRHVGADVVVDAAAGEDDLGLVAELLRLHRQVVRVDADAVAADQAGAELEEVPLRAGRLQHVGGADAHALEDDRQLVHQRDVEIALGVLDDLGRLGDLDRLRAVHARVDDRAVRVGDPLRASRRPRRRRPSTMRSSVCSLSPGLMRSGE